MKDKRNRMLKAKKHEAKVKLQHKRHAGRRAYLIEQDLRKRLAAVHAADETVPNGTPTGVDG